LSSFVSFVVDPPLRRICKSDAHGFHEALDWSVVKLWFSTLLL
jgi:hypothetical protein